MQEHHQQQFIIQPDTKTKNLNSLTALCTGSEMVTPDLNWGYWVLDG